MGQKNGDNYDTLNNVSKWKQLIYWWSDFLWGVLFGENKNGDIILFRLVHCMFDKHLNQFYFVELVHNFNRKWNQINCLFFTSNQMNMDQIKTDRCFNLQSLNLKSLYEIPFNLFVIYQVMCNQASEKKVQSVCVVNIYLNQNNHRNDTSNNSYYTCARRTTIFEIQISKSIMNIRQKVDKHILDNSKQDRITTTISFMHEKKESNCFKFRFFSYSVI